jgi:hypothetical protein
MRNAAVGLVLLVCGAVAPAYAQYAEPNITFFYPLVTRRPIIERELEFKLKENRPRPSSSPFCRVYSSRSKSRLSSSIRMKARSSLVLAISNYKPSSRCSSPCNIAPWWPLGWSLNLPQAPRHVGWAANMP